MKRQRWLFGLGAVAGAAAAGAAVARARRSALREEERLRRLRTAAARSRSIVILGAGFAGTNLAMDLIRRLPPASGWTVTLVDRRNYFLFTPLLYHAATGLVDPSAILFPVRSLTHAPNFVFREASVQAVDFRNRVVQMDDGHLGYDVLVIALGSVTNFFGQEQALPAALTLKTAADSIAIRNRIIDCFEDADVTTDPERRRRSLTFVVVGGGATGVELAGAIRGLITGTLARQYPRIRSQECRVMLLEALPGLLPTMPPELAEYTANRMRQLGIEVRVGCRVRRVDEDGLTTDDEEFIPASLVVWAAGVCPTPLARQLDVPRVDNGRILVDPFLEVPGLPGVYAVGDIAASEDPRTGRPLPPNAAVAVQQGHALSRIVAGRLEGGDPEPFRYHPRGELVSLGRHEAAAEVFGMRLTGFPAWLLWRAFYISQLMGFKNRLSVALDWTFAYMYQRDTVRLDVPAAGEEAETRPPTPAGAG